MLPTGCGAERAIDKDIGNGGGEGGCEVHNPGYDFNDEIITLGATLWSRVVETKLKKDAR